MTSKQIVFRSFRSLHEKRIELFKALILPASLYFLLALFQFFFIQYFNALIFSIPNIALYTIIAVTTHRIILLGDDAGIEFGKLRWTKNETYFAANLGILILNIFLLIMILDYFFGDGGSVIGVLFSLYFFSRCSLVFPAVSIGWTLSIKKSWQITLAYHVQMLSVIIFLPFVFSLIKGFIYNVLAESLGILVLIFSHFVDIAFMVLFISLLSTVYQMIIDEFQESQKQGDASKP